MKEQTLRLTGQSTGQRRRFHRCWRGGTFVPYSFETARMLGRTAATGRMLLPSHTCLRTSIIVGTNRRGGSLGCDIRGGEFRILDWMGSGSGPLPRRHCGKGQRRFRSAVHRSYSYSKSGRGCMSNCPDFLRGCRASAGSQRDLTPSEHERIIGQAAELSDYAKCSYCGIVLNARSTSSTRRLGWLDGIAGLGFKTATPAWACY